VVELVVLVPLGAALAGAIETVEVEVAAFVLPDPVVEPAVLVAALLVPEAAPVVELVAGVGAVAPAVAVEPVVGLLELWNDAGEGVALAAAVVLLDGTTFVVVALGAAEPAVLVGLVALAEPVAAVAVVDAAAEVAPYRPGSLPSGLDTVSCRTATAEGSFE
jgi:hypothetical protein